MEEKIITDETVHVYLYIIYELLVNTFNNNGYGGIIFTIMPCVRIYYYDSQ